MPGLAWQMGFETHAQESKVKVIRMPLYSRSMTLFGHGALRMGHQDAGVTTHISCGSRCFQAMQALTGTSKLSEQVSGDLASFAPTLSLLLMQS